MGADHAAAGAVHPVAKRLGAGTFAARGGLRHGHRPARRRRPDAAVPHADRRPGLFRFSDHLAFAGGDHRALVRLPARTHRLEGRAGHRAGTGGAADAGPFLRTRRRRAGLVPAIAADHAGLGRAGVFHAAGEPHRACREHLLLHDGGGPAAGAGGDADDRLVAAGQHRPGRPLDDGRNPVAQRDRRADSGLCLPPRQGDRGGAADQRRRTAGDRGAGIAVRQRGARNAEDGGAGAGPGRLAAAGAGARTRCGPGSTGTRSPRSPPLTDGLNMHVLLDLVARHKRGHAAGVTSICSAHPIVIEASLRHAQRSGQAFVLFEATCNQVNQEGGYTGMTPPDFVAFVHAIADRIGYDRARIALGGDHLGPNPWTALEAPAAMDKAEAMVAAYVEAGFRKIHLDCSMACKGDPEPLPEAEIVRRAVRLCQAAEAAHARVGGEAPVYVIGTEVPVPGGATEAIEGLAVTTAQAALGTIEAHRQAFAAAGLDAAWQRVIASVVQPGVEFDHHSVVDYQPARARELSEAITRVPGMVFEAHSTDYQTRAAL